LYAKNVAPNLSGLGISISGEEVQEKGAKRYCPVVVLKAVFVKGRFPWKLAECYGGLGTFVANNSSTYFID
jgi:hypothetical protein